MIQLKKGFLLRSVAGRTIVINDGDVLNLNLMIGLNDTGKFLWELAQEGTTEEAMKEALLAEYEVTEEIAEDSVRQFVQNLRQHDFLENNEE